MTAPGQVRDQAGGRWPLTYRAVPVPNFAAAAWRPPENVIDIASRQLVLHTEAFTGRWQVRYRDEQSTDRDRHGILWRRVVWAPGQGKPLYVAVNHPVRRRLDLFPAGLLGVCPKLNAHGVPLSKLPVSKKTSETQAKSALGRQVGR
jgi:hypothetical protein